jgi:ABC-type phosphate transport system substrate-binding protein
MKTITPSNSTVKPLARHRVHVLGCIGLLACNIATADIAVVVHAKNPVVSLSTEQVKRIFLGKIGTFPDHRPATPVDGPRGNTRDRFYLQTAQKNTVQMKAYWSQQTFTGGADTPQVLDTDEAVLEAIRNDTSAIGYVTTPVLKDRGVKTVLVLPP